MIEIAKQTAVSKSMGVANRSEPPLLVSVIIPTYNCARYLAEAIESVLNQTLSDFEIIVVDDGSRDGTARLMKQYQGQDKVRYIVRAHHGNAAARNCGIEHAQGTWLCFLDADDVWHRRKLELQLRDLHVHPGAKVSFPAGERFWDSNQVKPMPSGPPDAATLWDQLVRFQPFGSSLSGVMVERGCFEEVGCFDEQLQLSVDWDMWIRLAARFPIRWFDTVLVSVRVHSGGASRNAEMRLRMYLACLEKHRRFFSRQLGMSEAWRRSYSARLFRLGRHLLRNGRFEESSGCILRALRYDARAQIRDKLSVLTESLMCVLGWRGFAERVSRNPWRFTAAAFVSGDSEPLKTAYSGR